MRCVCGHIPLLSKAIPVTPIGHMHLNIITEAGHALPGFLLKNANDRQMTEATVPESIGW